MRILGTRTKRYYYKMKQIIIIGGGIGGLCTALALRQKGLTAQVYETVNEIKAVGAGIILAPNAMNVLARLGLADRAKALGMELEHLELTDAAGKKLMPVPNKEETIRDFGFAMIALLRSSLYDLLLKALPPNTVLTDKHFERYQENADDVTAHFTDGTQATGSVLIGADGVRSAVRRQLLPQVQLRYSGQTSYRGVANMALQGAQAHIAREAWGSPIRLGFVPIGFGQTYWYSTVQTPAGGTDADKASAKRQLLAWAQEFDDISRAIIENTPDQNIIRTDMYDLPPLPTWHNGRVVLLGDAAHATTPNLGQGGCQAIEDAFVIAEQLSQLSAQQAPQHAFAEYERIRKPKAELVVARSRQLGAMVHLHYGWQRALRNGLLRRIPASMGKKQSQDIHALNF